MDLNYREVMPDDIQDIKTFTDKWIGYNYFSLEELNTYYRDSLKNNQSASFLAKDSKKIVGVRLTLAPGKLIKHIKGLSPKLWDNKPEKVGYFKSLFVDENYQQNGVGKNLSQMSINRLKEMGAQAIVCHSWLESPNNSSQKYLQKMKFSAVTEHKQFWHEVDYLCTRCTPQKCICTAVEMINYL